MNQTDRRVRDRETAFIGKITAGISHELMNVLAIIRERSGLIEDLLALDKEGAFPHREKLTKTLTTILEQVIRGMAIGEKLNRFAHSMDEPRARLEINALLDQIALLMQRFARLKKIQLKVSPIEAPMEVDTDPFRILLVLAACLEHCMAHTAEGGEITLQYVRMKQGMTLYGKTG